MAKKSTTTDKKVFSFTTESPLVKQTEATVVQGYKAIEKKEQGGGAEQRPSASQYATVPPSPTQTAEPTKGVQAYIPMSMYRKLINLKYERGETIGNLLVQAIAFWLEKQEA